MRLETLPDWPLIQRRYEAWWEGEVLDRPLIAITAPKKQYARTPLKDLPIDRADMVDWATNPRRVLPRLLRQVEGTYYVGDAFPLVFPLTTSIPAIETAYLGAPVSAAYDSLTFWTDPIIDDWDHLPDLVVDPDNWWWRKTQELLELGARQGEGRYYASIPDIQGGGQIIAQLRGTGRLLYDLIDRPDFILPCLEKINDAWLQYHSICFEILHRYLDGYSDWLGLWSAKPHVTVECDLCAMISPRMFNTYFLPALEQQVEWIERTIYHLDGPQALPHLDALLGLSKLDGIQWVPGSGATTMSDWIPLLQRIQAAGKKLVIACEDWEVKRLLQELEPEGLQISTGCRSAAEADALYAEVCRMFGARVPPAC